LKPARGNLYSIFLEGGYNTPAIATGLHACVAALSGAFAKDDEAEVQEQPQEPAIEDIERAIG